MTSPYRAPSPASLSARAIHAGLVMGVVVFLLVAVVVGRGYSLPAWRLPERPVLYVVLFVVSGGLFGGAAFAAGRLPPCRRGDDPDAWWNLVLGRVVLIWALVEAPALLGIVAYLLTRDFRVLVATLAGLLLFGHFAPSRLMAPR